MHKIFQSENFSTIATKFKQIIVKHVETQKHIIKAEI